FKNIQKVGNGKPIKEKVQEYYSFRCIPQILGPILETVSNAEEILIDEVNSTNDNPVVDLENQHVYHGGNFHGDYVALEMDKVKIAITKLSMLCERQLNYLLNDKLNDIFPPFMNLGELGINFGVQGMQFTATSTTAENQTLSFPMSIHSIPNNNDNQDVVSMGTNAALMTKKVIDNSFQVMAIECIAIAQGVDYLDCHKKMSVAGQKFHDLIRQFVPAFKDDSPRSDQMKAVADFLLNNDPQVEFV
ncbi:MAG: aromatic amino acid lyase, partial [Flavobacteriales bacterium]|nr:aromatic amino acid lyase [Flavobacteriales bacterium]